MSHRSKVLGSDRIAAIEKYFQVSYQQIYTWFPTYKPDIQEKARRYKIGAKYV